MRNSKLLLIASVLLLALAVSGQGRPAERDIGSIEPQDIGQKVHVRGTVTSSSSYESTSFFNISDRSGEIAAVSFDSSKMFSTGEEIAVTGRVTLYQGKLELIVETASRQSSG